MKEHPCWNLIEPHPGFDMRTATTPDTPRPAALRITVHNAAEDMALEICRVVAAFTLSGQWGMYENENCETCTDYSGSAKTVRVFTPRRPPASAPEKTE